MKKKLAKKQTSKNVVVTKSICCKPIYNFLLNSFNSIFNYILEGFIKINMISSVKQIQFTRPFINIYEEWNRFKNGTLWNTIQEPQTDIGLVNMI